MEADALREHRYARRICRPLFVELPELLDAALIFGEGFAGEVWRAYKDRQQRAANMQIGPPASALLRRHQLPKYITYLSGTNC